MATIKRFEDLIAWQKSDEMETYVISLTQKGPFVRAFKLREQFVQAAGSVPANIAEGFNRGGDKEFRYHLSVSKASAGETRSWANSAKKQKLISTEELEQVRSMTRECERLIQGLINYLNESELKGSKFSKDQP